MVDKKAVAIVSIIALIIVGVILGIRIKNFNSYEYKEPKEEIGNAQNVTENQKSSKTEKSSIKNDSKNVDSEKREMERSTTDENDNSKSEEENNNVENSNSKNSSENTTIENNSTNTTNTGKNNSTSKTNTTEKDPEKLAISLAKEKWGKKNSNVYFDVEDKNEKKGIYTIVVRDSNSTIEIVTYKVDINKKTVTE